MKQSGQELTREQERILFDAEDKKDINQKASEAITTFVPTGIEIAKQLGTGAGEFLYKGILKPIDAAIFSTAATTACSLNTFLVALRTRS